jgi:hypothetical protein
MTPIEQAQLMFPNIPHEVFDIFLNPLIRNFGWPFRTILDDLYGTEWFRILYPLTLSNLCQFKWIRRVFLFNDCLLYPGSEADIKLVILNKTKNIWALIGRDSRSCRASLLWHEKNIMATGRFSAPITMAFTQSGLKVLDGIHRIAALFTLGISDTFNINAWICGP